VIDQRKSGAAMNSIAAVASLLGFDVVVVVVSLLMMLLLLLLDHAMPRGAPPKPVTLAARHPAVSAGF